MTILTVAALCLLSVLRGVDMVRFRVAEFSKDVDAVRPWVAVTGLAYRARALAVKFGVDPTDLNQVSKQQAGLIDVLSVAPLSSANWLLLAGMRAASGQRIEKIAPALVLSDLTGPNEGYVTIERAIFSIYLWEQLSPERRRRAVMDLTAVKLARSEIYALGEILGSKTEEVREEIRNAIKNVEGFSPDRLAAINSWFEEQQEKRLRTPRS